MTVSIDFEVMKCKSLDDTIRLQYWLIFNRRTNSISRNIAHLRKGDDSLKKLFQKEDDWKVYDFKDYRMGGHFYTLEDMKSIYNALY